MNRQQNVDPSEPADAYDRFALFMMRTGPFYEPRTKTLRIPHRYPCKPAVEQWLARKFVYDDKRFEYARSIPERFAFEQAQKARAFYFALYAAYRPEVTPYLKNNEES